MPSSLSRHAVGLVILIGAIIGLVLPALAADPLVFARSLYAAKAPWAAVTRDAATIKRLLAPQLADMVIKNAGKAPEDRLDYDPLTDAQESDITDLQVRLVETAEGMARVEVAFRNLGETTTLELLLESVGGSWKLADVVYDAEGSLRDELEFLNEEE